MVFAQFLSKNSSTAKGVKITGNFKKMTAAAAEL